MFIKMIPDKYKNQNFDLRILKPHTFITDALFKNILILAAYFFY